MLIKLLLALLFAKSMLLDSLEQPSSLLSPQPDSSPAQVTATTPSESLSCDEQCKSAAVINAGCFTDGVVYQSDCHARCAKVNNVRDFSCSDEPSGKCELVCQQTVRLRRCLTETCASFPANGSLFCFSNGAISANECRARCQNSSSTIMFDCRSVGLTSITCPLKCRTYVAATSNPACAGQPTDFPVCGRDGLIYDNECQASAANQTVISPAGGRAEADRAACVTAATQAAGVSLSQIVTRWSAIGN